MQIKRLPKLIGIALLGLGGHVAYAQTSVAVQTAEEIVVSSSRIDRQGFTAPTPTTVIGADVLQQRGTTNFADLLNELPSFKGSFSSAQGVPNGLSNGNGANLADLRGLGPVRTLVLVDKHRFVASTNTGRVDLNQIPTSLIQQIDVVTGGASAAYGSDAVSGVVNVMLKKSIDGILGTIQYGQSSHGDAKTSFISLASGTSFAGTRGQIIGGLEYSDDKGIVDAYTRDWGRKEIYFVTVIGPRPAGVPATVRGEGMHFSNITNGGLVSAAASNPAALRGIEFTGAGTRTYNYGLYANPATFIMQGGDNAGKNLNVGIPLAIPTRRLTGMSRITYDITDDLSAYAELSYANSRGITTGLPRRDGGLGNAPLTILPTNYYLQQALTPAQLALVPATGITIGRFSEDLGYPHTTTDNRTQRILAGLNGTFGAGWKWDLSAQTGQTNMNRTTTGGIVTSRFQSAINAISLGGVVVCADPVARAAGCQPLNILGNGAPDTTPAGKAYVTNNDAWYKQKNTLVDYAFNIQGEPFSSWAGPVSVAGGFEYRRETLNTRADAISQLPNTVGFQTGTYVLLPGTPGYSAQDVYVEAIVPLAKDLPFAKSLDFNGSFRQTDYSTSGKVNSWKAGMTYEPTQDLLLRGTRSRDIRAPNIFELFSPSGTSVQLNNLQGNIVLNFVGGNPALVPETADTTTLGFVLKPRFLKRFRFSTDFFKINIANQITSLSGVYLASVNCGGLPTCVITRNSLGAISRIDSTFSNISQFNVRGLDIEAAYSQPLVDLSSALKGTVDLSLLGSHYTRFFSSLENVDRVGQNLTGTFQSGPPKWTLNLTAAYKVDAFLGSVNLRFISRGKFDNTLIGPDDPNYSAALPNSVSDNRVPSITYVNLGASYDLVKTPSRSVQLFVSINNVADRDPPSPFNAAYYDLIGRAFKGGVRFKF